MTWLPQADEGSDMVRRKLIARPRLCGQATALFGQLDEHTPAVPTLEPLLSRGRPEHVAGPLEPRRFRPGTHTFAWRSKASRTAWQRPSLFAERKR